LCHLTPIAANTASNAGMYLASLSRMRNFHACAPLYSYSSMSRLRACRTVQAPVG
jgi:hypothetical protein